MDNTVIGSTCSPMHILPLTTPPYYSLDPGIRGVDDNVHCPPPIRENNSEVEGVRERVCVCVVLKILKDTIL